MSTHSNNKTVLLSIQCADMLYHYRKRDIAAGDITQQPIWQTWLEAAYADPEFLLPQNFLSVYKNCRVKPVEELTLTEIRASITFLLRRLRCEYPPYTCLTDGSLADLLMHWSMLATDGGKTDSDEKLQKDGENT